MKGVPVFHSGKQVLTQIKAGSEGVWAKGDRRGFERFESERRGMRVWLMTRVLCAEGVMGVAV